MDSSRLTPKPYPSDFPPKLKKYWEDGLQYSLTPIQSGWIRYYDDLAKAKARANTKKR